MPPRRRPAATARPEPWWAPRPAWSLTRRGQAGQRLRRRRPARASLLRMRPTVWPGSCRRCPRHPPPGPGRPQRTPDRNRGLRAPPAFPRGSRVRRERLSPPRTSRVRGPVRRVPPRPGPARLARPAHSARDLRPPRAARALPGSGRPGHGPRDPVRPGREPRGRTFPAGHVPAGHVRARGLVITRSARPRPVWARPHRPGPRVPFPVSRAVPVSGPTAPAAQGARVVPVPPGAVQEPRAVRVVPGLAGSPVHAPVVPGPAR
jgi:hypothetical protein